MDTIVALARLDVKAYSIQYSIVPNTHYKKYNSMQYNTPKKIQYNILNTTQYNTPTTICILDALHSMQYNTPQCSSYHTSYIINAIHTIHYSA